MVKACCFGLLLFGLVCDWAQAVDPQVRDWDSQSEKFYFSVADLCKMKPEDYFEGKGLEAANAIHMRDKEKLITSLEHWSVNRKGKHGMTLLHWAYIEHNVAAFEFLLLRGADSSARLEIELTEKLVVQWRDLSLAFSSVYSMSYGGDFLLKLSECEIDTNEKDPAGNTLLSAFLYYSGMVEEEKRTAISTKLLNWPFDLNSQNVFGQTAAHIAANDLRVGECYAILLAGGDPNIRDSDGNSVLDVLDMNEARASANFSRKEYSEASRKLRTLIGERLQK